MKQYLIFIAVATCIIWYSGMNHEHYVEKSNEKILKINEVKKMADAGTIKNPIDLSKEYFTKKSEKYIKKRSLMPFVYKKYYIENSEVEYWSRSR